MAIRGIVLDIGGVLEVISPTGWVDRWAADLALPASDVAERFATATAGADVGAVTEAGILTRLGEAFGVAPGRARALMDDFWAEYLGTLDVGMAAYFEALGGRYRTALLSNSCVGARERDRERYRLEELCHTVVYSHEVGMTKPDPRVYRHTCERLGVRPEEVAFVDDTPACVEGACAVGMHGVLFENTAQAIADVEALLRALALERSA